MLRHGEKLLKQLCLSLGIIANGFLMSGGVYATQSPPTKGPSVGHRPLTSGLILEYNSGNPSEFSGPDVELWVGDTIALKNPGGVDSDGDENEKGGYCDWYRVDRNNNTSLIKKEDGRLDCSYTLEKKDVGYRIRADVLLRSDKAKATAKGYTVNPSNGLTEKRVSAKPVTERHTGNGFVMGGVHSGHSGIGVVGQPMQWVVTFSGAVPEPGYTYESSRPDLFFTDGSEFFTPVLPVTGEMITMTATNKKTGRVVSSDIIFDKFYFFEEADNYGVAEAACAAKQGTLAVKYYLDRIMSSYKQGFFPEKNKKYGYYSPPGGGVLGVNVTESGVSFVNLNYWDKQSYICVKN